MVFVSVWTTGTSFVEISRFSPPVETLLKLIVSVFTTGDCVNKKKKGLGNLVKLLDFSERFFLLLLFFMGKEGVTIKSALHFKKQKRKKIPLL